MNVQEASDLFKVLISIFPNLVIPDVAAASKMWALVMPDIPKEAAQIAIIKHLRERRNFPAPADIVQAVESLASVVENIPTADQAWKEVIERANYYNPPKSYSHPVIMETVKTFDYGDEICHNDNISVTRAQFIKAYDLNVKRFKEARKNVAVANIAGGSEKLNALTENLAGKMDASRSPFRLVEGKTKKSA